MLQGKPIRRIALLTLGVWLILMIALFPASVALRLVADEFPANLPLEIETAEGTVWKGALGGLLEDEPVTATWDVRVLRLFTGKLAADVDLTSAFGQFSGRLTTGLSSVRLDGGAGAVDVNGLLPRFNSGLVSMEGELALDAFSATLKGGKLVNASGNLSWPGGRVVYQEGKSLDHAGLPPFNGGFQVVGGELTLAARDVDASFDVVDLVVRDSGWVTLSIRRRMLDLLDESWSPDSQPDDVVISLKRKAF